MSKVVSITPLVPAAEFPTANLPFGVVSGEGVDNYGKDGKEYTVAIALGKEEANAFKKTVIDFWNANKDGNKNDKPDNFDTMVKKKDGTYRLYVKSKTQFESGDPIVIQLFDAHKSPLDPEKFGKFGGATEGRVAVGLGIYSSGGKPKGVSRYIKAIQITEFAQGGSDSSSLFGEEEGSDLSGAADFKAEPKKKKKKKKK